MQSDGWTPDPLDGDLRAAFAPLRLGDGVAASVRAALPERPARALRLLGQSLCVCAAAGAAVCALLLARWYGCGYLGEGWDAWIGAAWIVGSAAALLVGIAFVVSARRLSEFDCRLVQCLTGRRVPAGAADVVLVRAGGAFFTLLAVLFAAAAG